MAKICFTGKQQSWVHLTVPMPVDCFSLPFIFHLIIHLSHPRYFTQHELYTIFNDLLDRFPTYGKLCRDSLADTEVQSFSWLVMSRYLCVNKYICSLLNFTSRERTAFQNIKKGSWVVWRMLCSMML